MVTPRHAVSNFDQLVTQWMSTVTSVCGSASNSLQLHCIRTLSSNVSAKLHLARSTRGVGPAESTGKSLTRCWPGGRRAERGSAAPLRRKPREIGGWVIDASVVGWAKRRRRVPTVTSDGGHGPAALSPPYVLFVARRFTPRRAGRSRRGTRCAAPLRRSSFR